MTESDWSLYRTFLAVVQVGNLSGAARLLGSTQPTVGRQIEKLEAVLDVSLFTRSPRGLLATEIALQLVPHAEAIAANVALFARTASGRSSEGTGTVRVTASEGVGVEILPCILANFAPTHPRIDVELSITNRYEDLLLREADIAVRMVRPTQQALIARRIGSLKAGLFAHRRYAELAGLPRTLVELAEHRTIGFDRDSRIRHSGGSAENLRRDDFRFRSDNRAAQFAMLKAGLGIAYCYTNVARKDPELVPVLPDLFKVEREMWLVMHENVKAVRQIKILFDYLARGLSAHVGDQDAPRVVTAARGVGG